MSVVCQAGKILVYSQVNWYMGAAERIQALWCVDALI